jgi:hypothetical protein
MRLETRIRRLETRAQSQDGPVTGLLRYALGQGSRLPIVGGPREPERHPVDGTAALLRLLGFTESHIKECTP